MIRSSGEPLSRARLKTRNEDFVVTEVLPFEPAGSGSHHFLCITQDGWNTASAARWLAQSFGCRERDVGYCGHKDRYAVTTQYFSVPADPRGDDAPVALTWPDGLTLVSASRHARKLRRGSHAGNRFAIRLRDIDALPGDVDERLEIIAGSGFPNYFGAQRFGHHGRNLERARALLGSGRFRRSRDAARSIEISSLRSFLFNEFLSSRVRDGSWMTLLDDDVLMLDGTHSRFTAGAAADEALCQRLREGDLHISGPLWGAPGRDLPESLVNRERAALSSHQADLDLLESRGFTMDRRPLRTLARELSWRWPEARVLELEFMLGPGSYATELLAEIFDIDDRRGGPAGL